MTQAKVGLIDIETAPLRGFVWGLWDQTVGLNQIDREWTILSYCFKPLGGRKKDIVYSDTQGDPLNDAKLVGELWQILDEYDFLIAQNGIRFDMKKIKARMILLGMAPPSPVRCIDTLVMAKRAAAFTSNKLEWLSTYLSTTKKDGHRAFPGFALWAECLKDNPKAWAAMRRYNIPDVTSMEEVYMRLRAWAPGHPNLAAYTDSELPQCPVCASTDLIQDGLYHTNVSKYHRYHCKACGSWSHDRYTINSKAKRRALLAG